MKTESILKTETPLIDRYSPEFVLRLHEMKTPCTCESCQKEPALSPLNWANESRHSARLECDQVAHAMLLDPQSFVLHSAKIPAQEGAMEPLSAWHRAVNQGCINLLICGDLNTEEKLYASGVFLSKMQRVAGDNDLNAVSECWQQLLEMAANGALSQQFRQLPEIETYKLEQLRHISQLPVDAALDPLSAMALMLKLNELNVLSDDYLADSLHEIKQDTSLALFAEVHPSLWTNYFVYRCYHDVFPGRDPQNYSHAFLSLCVDYFSLNVLCSLLAQSDCPPDEDNVPALFADWRRTAALRDAATLSADPLLMGLSLLS